MPPKDCPPNAGDVFVPIVMLVIPACASTALQTREKDVNPARYVTRQSIVRSSTNISILGSVPQSRNCDDRLLPCRRQMSQVCGKHDQNKPDGGCPRDSSAADLSRAVRERLPRIDRFWNHRLCAGRYKCARDADQYQHASEYPPGLRRPELCGGQISDDQRHDQG